MKLHYCYLERFNNYFNRKIIKYDLLSDYEDKSKNSFIPVNNDGTMTSFDFNPNDNVMTEIIGNDVPFDADYFLLLDDSSNIVQRWFVLEQKRNRQGQWVYTLKRDVIADNINNLLKAPIFVQKGMLSEDDPFIFNSEGMDFNQIKKSETLLKDLSNSSWIVCYLAKSLSSANINVEVPSAIITPEYYSLGQIAVELGISEAELASALNINPGDNNVLTATNNFTLKYSIITGGLPGYSHDGKFNISSDFSETSGQNWSAVYSPAYPYLFYNEIMTPLENQIKLNRSALIMSMPSFLSRNYYLRKEVAETVLNKYNGKIILYLGSYYTLSVGSSGTIDADHIFKPSNDSLWNSICHNANGSYDYFSPTAEVNLQTHEVNYSLTLSTYTPAVIKYEASISSSRKVCNNQEFDIVAIPASDIIVQTTGPNINQKGKIAQMIASALAIKEGTNIYDIQLLPYCPRPDMINEKNVLSIKDFNINEDFDYIEEVEGGNRANIGVMIYVQNASFVSLLDYSLSLKVSKKIDSQCDFYRIVSPNYQGSFEFNVAKNGGAVREFYAYCTYKPYTPFIKVTPLLDDLYGDNFNDNRGLICAGDFSLPRSSSAWEQYQLENKNYQNIFNREIQNMNFMQSIEMRNQKISGAVGIFSDTAKGAGAGAFVGGGPGALIGGVVGGITSGIGYAIDTDTLAKTQRETRQLAIDKYNYQLGNIKALPYTLTKVGSFDVSSKIFPFLEYYTCTDKEKEALENKILYESMTVMRIGTLEEFMNFNGKMNYFKGELIRNDEIAEDPHTLNAIYEEFLKGVYI